MFHFSFFYQFCISIIATFLSMLHFPAVHVITTLYTVGNLNPQQCIILYLHISLYSSYPKTSGTFLWEPRISEYFNWAQTNKPVFCFVKMILKLQSLWLFRKRRLFSTHKRKFHAHKLWTASKSHPVEKLPFKWFSSNVRLFFDIFMVYVKEWPIWL